MSRWRTPQYVEWAGKLVPRSLVEGFPGREGSCGYCQGLGLVPEQLDEDRWPVMVPCVCQRYCKVCQKWVTRDGHTVHA